MEKNNSSKKHHAVHHNAAENSKKSKSNYDVWKIISFILLILLIASIITSGFGVSVLKEKETSIKALSGQEVGEKSLEYIKKVVPGQTVKLNNVTESKGLYLLNLEVAGQKFESYATKDGKLLFASGINLDVAPQTATQQQEQAPQDIPKSDKPTVLLFTMSYCPYGNIADEAMGPAYEAISSKINFEPHYVIYSNYRGGGPSYCLDDENKYCSMHGIQELNQDVRELCIWKYDKSKYWDFVLDVNTACSSSNVDTCWEAVAKKYSIDTEKIKTCEKDEALTLLAKEVELNTQYGISGSPAVVINGQDVSLARTPQGYLAGICSAFNTAPSECDNVELSNTQAAASGNCG